MLLPHAGNALLFPPLPFFLFITRLKVLRPFVVSHPTWKPHLFTLAPLLPSPIPGLSLFLSLSLDSRKIKESISGPHSSILSLHYQSRFFPPSLITFFLWPLMELALVDLLASGMFLTLCGDSGVLGPSPRTVLTSESPSYSFFFLRENSCVRPCRFFPLPLTRSNDRKRHLTS